MSLFGGFMRDFDDDPFFGFKNLTRTMSRHKKNSISYTIPANNGDSDDENYGYGSVSRSKTNHNGLSSMNNGMGDLNSMINAVVSNHCNMFVGSDLFGRRGRQNQLMPFGFPDMNNIFESFQMSANNPNCHSFSSSTVMTMSSGPDGRPQVYQASQSTRTAPGGIRETKKSVCDSRTGTKKLAIGHHIGDRAHVLEREHNMHSGQQEERQEFINLDEDEAEDFNREWETKTRGSMNAIGYNGHRSHSRRPREDLPAIQDRYRPRARTTSRRNNYSTVTSNLSSNGTTERGKKRCHVEHVISSDEEEEEVIVTKNSNKKSKSS